MTPDERKAAAVVKAEAEVVRLRGHAIRMAAAAIDVGVALAERFGTTEEDARVIRAAVGVVVDRLVFGLYPPTGGGSDE